MVPSCYALCSAAALLPIFSFLSGCLGPRPGPLLRYHTDSCTAFLRGRDFRVCLRHSCFEWPSTACPTRGTMRLSQTWRCKVQREFWSMSCGWVVWCATTRLCPKFETHCMNFRALIFISDFLDMRELVEWMVSVELWLSASCNNNKIFVTHPPTQLWGTWSCSCGVLAPDYGRGWRP